MHTGVSAVIVVWLFRFHTTPWVALVFLLGISVGWEILEEITPHFMLMAGGLTDTIGDVISNVTGWAFVVLVRWWINRT
ncbi:hypothetical protein [Haloferax profundi]|nr:hypothetical protein [Haloferax profundi]